MDEKLKDQYSRLVSLVVYKADSSTVIEKVLPLWSCLISDLTANQQLFTKNEIETLRKIGLILEEQISNKIKYLTKLSLNNSIPKKHNKENTNKQKEKFTFNTYKEAIDFSKLWANEFFDVSTHRFQDKFEVNIKPRVTSIKNKITLSNENLVKNESVNQPLSDKHINIQASPYEYVKSQNNKITSFTIASDTPIYLECLKCKNKESAFKVMSSENQLNKNNPEQNTKLQYIKKILPRLKCQKCSSNLLLLIPQEINVKVIYVATNSTKNNKFHKSTCGWMKNVPAGSEIKFKSREDAINTGFSPCNSCKP